MSELHLIFCALLIWPWHDPHPLLYVMYLRFCGWRHVLLQLALWRQDATAAASPQCRAQANTPVCVALVATCPRRQRALILDESIVQGRRGRNRPTRFTVGLFSLNSEPVAFTTRSGPLKQQRSMKFVHFVVIRPGDVIVTDVVQKGP